MKDVLQETPEGDKRTYAELLIRTYVSRILEQTDGTAIRDAIDRVDGKALQKIQVENEKVAEFIDLYKDLRNDIKREAEGDTTDQPKVESEDTDS